MLSVFSRCSRRRCTDAARECDSGQDNDDQVRRRIKSNEATAMLYRVGQTHSRGVFQSGNPMDLSIFVVGTRTSGINIILVARQYAKFVVHAGLLFQDGRGEEEEDARSDANVRQGELFDT